MRKKYSIVAITMHIDLWYGISLLVLAGIFQGSFAVFFRFSHPLRFEQYWFIYALVGLFICPYVVVLVAVPHAYQAILSVSTRDIIFPVIFGAVWGISGITLGKSLERIGIAATYTIVFGISVISSVFPLVFSLTTQSSNRTHTIEFLAGFLIAAVSIILSAYGRFMHNSSNAKAGIIYAVISGILSPAFSLAITLGRPIAQEAIRFGASQTTAIFLLWFVLLCAGFSVVVFYSLYDMTIAHPMNLFMHLSPKTVMASILAGIFWFSAFALYSIAPEKLGLFGQAYGWASFIAISLIIAAFWGYIYHEWRKKGFAYQLLATCSLLFAIVLIGMSL